jgi:serralysin
MTDIAADTSTTAHISVGDTYTGTIETGGDHDWIAIDLVAGQKYTFTLNGSGANALEDPYLYLLDSSGTVVVENDDGNGSRDSRIVFTATTSGTYYLDAAAWGDATHSYTGDYTLSAQKFTPPPVYSYTQIADQLVNGYWGGDWHSFDVTQGGTITVNLTALTTAGQTLARAALAEWSDVIGVNFQSVTTGGQIVFDDSDDGAYTDSAWSNHVISTSNVNISTQWISDYGTSLDSYSFQTYVHEIGHALGLGHAGNYNDTATYPDDALYSNDAWSATVMSYFSPEESSYFADQGFSYDFALTPMSGDILAMQTLYGLSTTTRTGDTTYGYASNSGNAVFNTTSNPDAAYTIFDSGGTDTLNYAGSGADQLINLNPETFSNVAGQTGNVSIAVGTVIENATGGSGDDTIVGNAANNLLNGGSGNDTVSYEAAAAGVTVDLRSSGQQDTVGAGRDTLSSFENLVGSGFGDTLVGASTTVSISGGDGNDRITATTSSTSMYGGTGDDTYVVSDSSAKIYENVDDGTDSVQSSVSYNLSQNVENLTLAGSAAINATGNSLANVLTGNSGNNLLVGGAGDDQLAGAVGNDKLLGDGGNDRLDGGAGNDRLIGGTGDDTYIADSYSDAVVENAGEGHDQVSSSADFVLRANVEDLTLTGSAGIWGYGNDIDNALTGNSAANKLFGLAGNDLIDGKGGADRLFGGTGDDTYYVDNYSDHLVEVAGEGTDTVFASTKYKLAANVENLTITGTADLWAYGNDANNTLTGNSGINKLYGLGGSDALSGGSGNDWLEGGAGKDTLNGGSGNDSFVFRAGDFGGATTGTADVIQDFTNGEDHIRLNFIDANTTISGEQAFAFMGTAAFDGHAGELRYEQVSGNTYVSGDTNGDGTADFMIRLDGLHTLASSDFVL